VIQVNQIFRAGSCGSLLAYQTAKWLPILESSYPNPVER
jgi:hypothetical protein